MLRGTGEVHHAASGVVVTGAIAEGPATRQTTALHTAVADEVNVNTSMVSPPAMHPTSKPSAPTQVQHHLALRHHQQVEYHHISSPNTIQANQQGYKMRQRTVLRRWLSSSELDILVLCRYFNDISTLNK